MDQRRTTGPTRPVSFTIETQGWVADALEDMAKSGRWPTLPNDVAEELLRAALRALSGGDRGG